MVTCLNNYRPVALAYVAMMCFERLVMAHNTIILEILDSLQFAYRPNRSTDDAISIRGRPIMIFQRRYRLIVQFIYLFLIMTITTILNELSYFENAINLLRRVNLYPGSYL